MNVMTEMMIMSTNHLDVVWLQDPGDVTASVRTCDCTSQHQDNHSVNLNINSLQQRSRHIHMYNCHSPQCDLPSVLTGPGSASGVCPGPIRDGVCSILANIWATCQGSPSSTPRRLGHWHGICSCTRHSCMRICIWLISQSAVSSQICW